MSSVKVRKQYELLSRCMDIMTGLAVTTTDRVPLRLFLEQLKISHLENASERMTLIRLPVYSFTVHGICE